MYCLIDFCCICFCNKEHLQHLSDSDSDNITYHTKLMSCVAEMCFDEINNHTLICNKCCETMNTAYKFRQRCLRSKTTLTDYISGLHKLDNISGEVNIYLSDINKFRDTKQGYQKENEKTRMFKNVNEDDNKSENSKSKTEHNPNSLKLNDTEDNFIHFENVVIKMEQKYEDSEEYEEESSDNPLVNWNETEVKQNDNNLMASAVEEEIENKYFGENLYESFDNVLETSDNINNDNAAIKLEKNYFLNSIKCADDPSINLDEIKIEIVENEKPVNREINILSEVADIEGFSKEEHAFPLEDEDRADNDTATMNETSKSELSKLQDTDNQKIKKNKRYMEIHTAKKQVESVIRGKTFRDSTSFNRHKKSLTEENSIECSVCHKKLAKLSYLIRHMRIHLEEKLYECSVCPKKFFTSSDLRTHTRIHTGERPYECSICQKKFINSSNLKIHMRNHTGEKPYECSICQNKFINSSNLKIHMRFHTGERPYECSECQNKFTNLSTLKTHIRNHTKEKSFECSICQNKFVNSYNLNRHMKIHTGEKVYECSVCQNKFTQASTLKIHKRTHTTEKSY